jgi:hypothetical protein
MGCPADGNRQDIGERIDDVPVLSRVREVREAAGKHIRRPNRAEQGGRSRPSAYQRTPNPVPFTLNLYVCPGADCRQVEENAMG